jgi:hypothetical protein
MKVILYLAGIYLAVGAIRCFTSADGMGYATNMPTVFNTGDVIPVSNAQPCSNHTLECMLKWPMWNATKCNTHF